ncbi:MAG: hypothetical protein AAFX05_12135, partial [Planctomycetota bacterium]
MLDCQQRPFVGALLPALLHAALFGLAFPPADLWWLAFLAPLPAAWAGVRTSGPLRTALAFALLSLPLWAYHHRWTFPVSAAGFFPLVLNLALYSAAFVWLLAIARRGLPRAPLWVLAPVVWIGVETLQAKVLWNGYPWFLIAHPTIAWQGFAALASVIGVSGVGLLTVLQNRQQPDARDADDGRER